MMIHNFIIANVNLIKISLCINMSKSKQYSIYFKSNIIKGS